MSHCPPGCSAAHVACVCPVLWPAADVLGLEDPYVAVTPECMCWRVGVRHSGVSGMNFGQGSWRGWTEVSARSVHHHFDNLVYALRCFNVHWKHLVTIQQKLAGLCNASDERAFVAGMMHSYQLPFNYDARKVLSVSLESAPSQRR